MKTVLSASPTLVVVRLGPTATKSSPWCITPTLWSLTVTAVVHTRAERSLLKAVLCESLVYGALEPRSFELRLARRSKQSPKVHRLLL
eukprot:4116497-Amphidinium_carterae.1